jgi:hypothetical protein
MESDDLHSGDPGLNFLAERTLDELIAQQGKSPILDARFCTVIFGRKRSRLKISLRH